MVGRLAFWKAVARDKTNLLERMVSFLADRGIRYCVVGGQAVNAYAEPLVSLDLDLAVAAEQLSNFEGLLRPSFSVTCFPHRLNVSAPGSDLRVQFQTNPRYAAFVPEARPREVLGLLLPVAKLEDVLRGKVWAAQDPERRKSKRQKDLADIARILDAHPALRDQVPAEILDRLV